MFHSLIRWFKSWALVLKRGTTGKPVEVKLLPRRVNPVKKYHTPDFYPIILTEFEKNKIVTFSEIIREDARGILEYYFFDYLVGKFNHKVKNNVQLILNNKVYIPDFILCDDLSNKNIVIEIDEPYSIDSKNEIMPIHVRGEDDDRNREMLNNGWIIIRFAEEQIAKDPQDCLRIIDSVISSIAIEENTPICWDYNSCLKMISENYRNSYLPLNFIGIQKIHSDYSYRSFIIDGFDFCKAKNNNHYICVRISKPIPGKTCWIPYNDFFEYFKTTEYYKKALEINIDLKEKKSPPQILLWRFLRNSKLEGYGKISGPYFNLNDDNKFKIIISQSAFCFLNEYKSLLPHYRVS